MTWNMKQLGLIALTTFAFVACDEDNKESAVPGPSNKTITVSDTSAYNSTNFVKSLEQYLTTALYRYNLSFDNTFKDGNLQTMVASRKEHGELGAKYTISPVYNDKGVVTSHTIANSSRGGATFTQKIVFDNEGYLKYLTDEDNTIQNFSRNDKKQISQIIRIRESRKDTTKYEYNEKGQLSKRNTQEITYNEKGLLSKSVYPASADYPKSKTYTYKYDAQDRLISVKYDGKGSDGSTWGNNVTYEYSTDTYTEKRYDDSSPDVLKEEKVYAKGGITKKENDYVYDNFGGKEEFSFKRVTDYNNEGKSIKISYYDGTLASLTLQGYMDIVYKEDTKEKFSVEGKVYDKDGKHIYTKTEEDSKTGPSSTSTKDASGKVVGYGDTPSWVNKLYLPSSSNF